MREPPIYIIVFLYYSLSVSNKNQGEHDMIIDILTISMTVIVSIVVSVIVALINY
jgi:hypothetical protein